MRKAIWVFYSFLLIFITARLSSAAVIGSGTFDLIVPGNYSVGGVNNSTSYTDPVTGENISVSNYFADISEASPYAWIAFGLNYVDGNLAGSGSYRSSSVSGSHNGTTGGETFTFSAANYPGKDYAHVFVDFASTASFFGVLDNFGYAFDYSGRKDGTNDTLYFSIQMEIWGNFEGEGWKAVYSDYGYSHLAYDTEAEQRQHYLTNRFGHSVTDVGVNITKTGTINFNYSTFDQREWKIYWDFMAGGTDYTDQTTTVPEPSSLLLLGAGLAGVGILRRKFK